MSGNGSRSSSRTTRWEVRGDEGSGHADERLDLDDTAEELSGKLASNPDEERLMRSVLEGDEEAMKDGKLIAESYDRAIGSFTPDLLFEQLVQSYQNAERLYGKTLLRELTSYTPDYLRKNLKIPEFRSTLRGRIEERIGSLKQEGIIDADGFPTDYAARLAAIVLYAEELESLMTKGIGKEELRERSHYGEKDGIIPFRKGRYRDVALRRSIKTALRRGHRTLQPGDLQAYERINKGRIQVIYAMDASGSMRGEKIRMAKRAGIALAFRAIEERNEAGLVIFSSDILEAVPPCRDFAQLLDILVRTRPSRETDVALTIEQACALFSRQECTKHLVILTDAIPTRGKDPVQETLRAASAARDQGITISIIGIGLEEEGERLARDVVEVGNGRLYRVADLGELDTVILEEYDRVSSG